jgi:hypothetical protein
LSTLPKIARVQGERLASQIDAWRTCIAAPHREDDTISPRSLDDDGDYSNQLAFWPTANHTKGGVTNAPVMIIFSHIVKTFTM